jgi:hypothetical protein
LGTLFKLVSSVGEIKKAFESAIYQENIFRGSQFTREDVINDIIDVAWKYSQWLVKGADNSFEEISRINRGLDRLGNHIVGTLDSAALKMFFGQIVYILRLLQSKEPGEIVKNVDMPLVQNMRFSDKHKTLGRLKTLNSETYFYWILGVGERG